MRQTAGGTRRGGKRARSLLVTGATRPTVRGQGLRELATFACTLSCDDLPERVLKRAKITLQHNLLVALAARHEAIPGQDRACWPAEAPLTECATRLTDGRLAPAERAVVTNALAMGARAQHDEHPGAISHFGSTVIPALLATAEIHRVDGARVVAAMVAGYEVGARIAKASIEYTRARGFRPTGLYGPFAAAAATGSALGLSPDALVNALALAANSSAGFMQTWLAGTDEWRYQTAFAGRNGFVAACLAADGVRGAENSLDGERGFHAAFAGVKIDDSRFLENLGREWAVENLLLKPYPVCAFNQAPVQQILRLKAEHQIDGSAVECVRVHMDPQDLVYPGVDTPGPVKTRAEALMCVRTCIASALLDDDVFIDRLDSPDTDDVRRLWHLIEIVADPAIPSHTSWVELITTPSSTVSSGSAQPVVYDEGIRASLVERLLPYTGLDRPQMQTFLNVVDTLDRRNSIDDLLDAIRMTAARR